MMKIFGKWHTLDHLRKRCGVQVVHNKMTKEEFGSGFLSEWRRKGSMLQT
jgi:hypothetical protein